MLFYYPTDVLNTALDFNPQHASYPSDPQIRPELTKLIEETSWSLLTLTWFPYFSFIAYFKLMITDSIIAVSFYGLFYGT